ncbi:ShlB/FhaC/HecB family hemolysin secretion/activation protein [Sphingomonas sp. MMS24-J13]|uniref:ShlB/FhaC/HecB family hemolysin secretion/activation protein n=1 Tax=Sphingomonas sp. MMS24-J13 TaxID=3238686 RepID=UPI00384D7D66
MPKLSNIAAALLVVSQGAMAQQPPTAGQQIQQIPPAPVPDRAAPDIRIERGAAPLAGVAAGAKARIATLHVTGQTLFSEATLIAASGFAPGDLDLAGMRQLAARIAAFYNIRGYILAQAYVPAQDVANATLTIAIAIVEGRYGAVKLNNHSRLHDKVATNLLGGIEPGDPVAIAPLERRLLLLSDIPGTRVRSTLSPGGSVGTSDLIVDVTPGRSISGDVEGDNSGNRYTGSWRLGGTINLNNPTGHGDVASLRLLTSFSGLFYGRASYQTLFGATTVGVAYAHINYSLGKEFKSLDGKGSADIASIYASHPLIRSRNANLYLVGDVDLKRFHDRIGSIDTNSRKHAAVLALGLNGDERDSIGGGGWSSYSIGGSVGQLDIRSPIERDLDALTAHSNGTYGKLQGSAARLQRIAGPLSLYAAVRGQFAFDNLDTSEKMELGGAYGVRAYPEGEAYGDEGYIATIEARLAVSQLTPRLPGQLQLIGFVDVGAVTLAKDPWYTGTNHAHRSGYGVGLDWSGGDGWAVKASYARKLGSQGATSAPDRSGRFWFQIAKFF